MSRDVTMEADRSLSIAEYQLMLKLRGIFGPPKTPSSAQCIVSRSCVQSTEMLKSTSGVSICCCICVYGPMRLELW
jgi:hypothetical protein